MKFGEFYNKHYKKLLIIPAILILLSLTYMFYFYHQNNDFLLRDVSLTGGTSLTLKTQIPVQEMQEKLSNYFSDVDIKSLADNSGKQTHLIIVISQDKEELVRAIESELGITLNEENSSIEFTQGSLGEEFYNQLLRSMLFAFLLMALVVFMTFGESKIIKAYASLLTLIAMKLTFPEITQISLLVVFGLMVFLVYGFYFSESGRQKLILLSLSFLLILLFLFPIYFLVFMISIVVLGLYTRYSAPSIAVLVSAFADIIFTVATVNLLGMKVSSGGIIAFLMLIGYSVGTDVLLTSRVLHRKGESVNQACLGAFKTGAMMTLTAIASIFIGLLFVYRFETVLNQIFIIILIGLGYDLFNTWFTNVWIIKWYAESKNKYDVVKK